MAVEAVKIHSVEPQQSPKTKMKSQQNITSSPEVDEEKSNATRLMIGATALAAVIGLGIAGYHGKLGKGVEELLRGTEKSSKKAQDAIEELTESGGKPGRAGAPVLYDDVPVNSGVFGQDIYDPLDSRNAHDIMSPYYQNPFSTYGEDPFGNPLDSPLGGGFGGI